MTNKEIVESIVRLEQCKNAICRYLNIDIFIQDGQFKTRERDGELREMLADYAHNAWSGWMKHLFTKCMDDVGQFDKSTGNLVIPKQFVYRWMRQMSTQYSELSENEKDSDRIEADKILRILVKKENK